MISSSFSVIPAPADGGVEASAKTGDVSAGAASGAGAATSPSLAAGAACTRVASSLVPRGDAVSESD